MIVVDEAGHPVGLLSDFDLLAGEWLSADAESLAAMRRMTAGELMSTPLNTIEGDRPIRAAADRMRDRALHRLVVTEGGTPVGVLSLSDFVAHLAAQEPMERATVEDVMSYVVLVCREETPALEVARGLTDSRFRSVVVVDAAGRLRGVISVGDFLGCIDGESCAGKSAAEIMHRASTIDRKATLRKAATQMIEHHLHRLVVIDFGHTGSSAGGDHLELRHRQRNGAPGIGLARVRSSCHTVPVSFREGRWSAARDHSS